VFGHEVLDALDEVGLFGAGDAGFVPFVKNLLEIFDLQLVEVRVLEVDLFVVAQVADLPVLLLQLLADFLDRHAPADGFGHLGDDVRGRVGSSADHVAEPLVLVLGRFAPLFELVLDGTGVGFVSVGQRRHEFGHGAVADFAVVGLLLRRGADVQRGQIDGQDDENRRESVETTGDHDDVWEVDSTFGPSLEFGSFLIRIVDCF